MNEIAERIMRLCNPDAESMSDFDRINAFVNAGVDAAQEITRLEGECFKLAAGFCEYRGGDDHGNALCLKTNQSI